MRIIQIKASIFIIEKLIKDSKNANADGDKTIISLIDTFESLQALNIEQPKIAHEKVNKIISKRIRNLNSSLKKYNYIVFFLFTCLF